MTAAIRKRIPRISMAWEIRIPSIRTVIWKRERKCGCGGPITTDGACANDRAFFEEHRYGF